MSTQNDDNQGVVWTVLIGVVLLAISLAIGFGLYRTGKGAAPTTAVAGASTGVAGGAAPGAVGTASADGAAGTATGVAAAGGAAPASTADMTTAAADGPSIRVENGVVKFYFASGKADLAAGANEALADVVKGVAEGKMAVVSGFHDATGDAALNAELAKQRALAVRDALKGLGVAEDKIELKKPEETTATGSNAEARRVEVVLGGM